ncbi:MAG TPA: ROK family protein [Ktedonobacteraceae bacterium]|jgi:glucokinase
MHAQVVAGLHYPLVVGIDLGGTQIRVAVLQGAELRSRVSLPTGETPTPQRVIPRIHAAIEQALELAGISLGQLAGIGICVTGPLDSRSGVVFESPNLPEWNNIPLRSVFEAYYGLPIFIENDANAAALGEYAFGAGRGCKDLVYITVSTGIGGGVIVDGKLMTGTSGAAAELGHITIDRKGERCNCGNIGCLESIASGTAIARRACEALARGERVLLATDSQDEPGRVDAKAVAEAAEAGIPAASAIIQDAAEGLGVGLVSIIHIFNPEMVILGGGLTQMGSLLLQPALQIVQERTMRVACNAVRIESPLLGINAGLVGAGALVYNQIEEDIACCTGRAVLKKECPVPEVL